MARKLKARRCDQIETRPSVSARSQDIPAQPQQPNHIIISIITTSPPNSRPSHHPIMPSQISSEDLARTVLARHLPHFTRIITYVSIANLYYGTRDAAGDFTWENRNERGSMFLCATKEPTSTTEDYHIIILSRWGIGNFIFTLTSAEGLELGEEVHFVLSSECGVTTYKVDNLEPLCYGIIMHSPPGTSVADQPTRMTKAVLECAAIKAKELAEKNPVEIEKGLEVGGAPPELRGFSILDQVFPSLQNAPQQVPPPPSTQQQGQMGQNGNLMGMLFPNGQPQY